MKNVHLISLCLAVGAALSCSEYVTFYPEPSEEELSIVTPGGVARILSSLPLGPEHLREVHDAVGSSSGNGYDEEYMLSDLFSNPGGGVGDSPTKAATYAEPLRDLFEAYLERHCASVKSGGSASEYISALTSSDMQIYWPFSDGWDGSTYPVITFDPGFGAESNYGYEIGPGPDGPVILDTIVVDESVAMRRPVWVINRNDDSAFTPLDLFEPSTKAPDGRRTLVLESFEALRNYDSWFAGASEFWVKCGVVDGFKATKEEDLRNYSPSVTDFMVVVKRSRIKSALGLGIVLMTDFTDQTDKLAFMVTEDDGGQRTSWKCSATVKWQSKAYGFDVELPYNTKDDIVWRGQLAAEYLDSDSGKVTGRFGDVKITFALK